MIASIRYAQRIQEATLPTQKRLKKYLPEHFILYKPRDIVSGDFYWFLKKQGKAFLVVADCTGHGVPGAFMAMLGITSLNYLIGVNDLTAPAKILKKLDGQISAALNQKTEKNLNYDGMVLAMCVFDFEQRKLTFASAERPLYIVRGKHLTKIQGNKHIIGGNIVETTKSFTQQEVPIEKNDMLYLFSDGYTDQFGGGIKKKKFSTRRFQNLLCDIAHLPPEEQSIMLEKTLQEWQGSHPQIDDILVVGLKISF
ncbi:MAG: PP2C family protein-serine/threonine phosphatase, partial [Thermonemataceae bacterium]